MNRKLVFVLMFVLIVIIAAFSIPAYVGIKALTYSNPYKDRKEKLQADFSSFPTYPGTTCIENKTFGCSGGILSAPPFCERLRLMYCHRIMLDITPLTQHHVDFYDIHHFYYNCLKSAGLASGNYSYDSGGPQWFYPRSILSGRDTVVIIEHFESRKGDKDVLGLLFFVFVENLTEPTK